MMVPASGFVADAGRPNNQAGCPLISFQKEIYWRWSVRQVRSADCDP